MGYSTLIDILGAMFVGGILLLILLRMNGASAQNSYSNSGELIVQQNLTTIVGIIENDFRKIGYCEDWTKIPEPSKVIVQADTSKIKFISDTDLNGTMDTVYYYLGSTSALTSTPNPRDRLLYRLINNEAAVSSNLGVTQFKLTYYDSNGSVLSTPVANPGEISSIEISLTVENTDAYNQEYESAYWKQVRLTARNLTNR